MGYYEYAPEAFQWLATYDIKPWLLFKYVFLGALFFGLALLIIPLFLKSKKWIVRLPLMLLGVLLLTYGTRLDKSYLAYESNKACSEPGIYIKRQVEANGYVDFRTFGLEITNEELKTLKDILPYGMDTWIAKEDSYCKQVASYDGYQFNEDVSVQRNYKDRTNLNYFGKTKNLDLDNQGKKKAYEYSTRYIGLKEGQCYLGYLNKPTARYYIIEAKGERVGLGLERYKTYIIDAQTGEEIAYSIRFTIATNALNKLLVGGFGSTDQYCGNSTIKTEKDMEIKEYRKASQMERNTFVMTRFTLIPSQYYH